MSKIKKIWAIIIAKICILGFLILMYFALKHFETRNPVETGFQINSFVKLHNDFVSKLPNFQLQNRSASYRFNFTMSEKSMTWISCKMSRFGVFVQGNCPKFANNLLWLDFLIIQNLARSNYSLGSDMTQVTAHLAFFNHTFEKNYQITVSKHGDPSLYADVVIKKLNDFKFADVVLGVQQIQGVWQLDNAPHSENTKIFSSVVGRLKSNWTLAEMEKNLDMYSEQRGAMCECMKNMGKVVEKADFAEWCSDVLKVKDEFKPLFKCPLCYCLVFG